MKKQIAFIDENGNFGYDFEKDGVSTHFIITAILIDEDKLMEIEKKVEAVRKNHFQTGEMKSQKVADNDIRRIKILTDLRQIDFHIFSIVIDKRKLRTDGGLKFKPSFYKFLNKLVHDELFEAFPELQIISDEHGRKEFMEGFKLYVEKNHIPNLFQEFSFGFSNSKSEILIQLADFICGTISKGFQEKLKSENYNKFFKLIQEKIVGLREWPETYKDYLFDLSNNKSVKYNEVITRLSIDITQRFIEKNKDDVDSVVKDQVDFMRFLLFNLKYLHPDKYVPTHEIINNLNALREKPINRYYLRLRIVAKLRDQGVLIASSDYGYKIPISEKDLYDFVNHCNSIVMPMLSRLGKCRNYLLLATKNEFDVLGKEEYETLKKFFD